MNLVEVKVNCPKELNEIGDFVALLLQKLVTEKLPAGEVLTAVIPAGIAAIEGFQNLKEEIKSKEMYDFAALLAAKIAKTLIK
jgi:hypothetical protein